MPHSVTICTRLAGASDVADEALAPAAFAVTFRRQAIVRLAGLTLALVVVAL